MYLCLVYTSFSIICLLTPIYFLLWSPIYGDKGRAKTTISCCVYSRRHIEFVSRAERIGGVLLSV